MSTPSTSSTPRWWRRMALVPSLLAAIGGLNAAEGDQLREHTLTVVDLVNAEMRMPAERALEAFEAVGYSDPGNLHGDALRYYLAWQFSVTAPPEAAEQYAAQAEELYGRLQPQLEDMPEYLRALVDKKGLVPRLATKISNKMNPDMPPPLVAPTPTDISTLKGLFRRLLESADATFEAQLAHIEAYKDEEARLWDFEEENAEFWAITQEATMRRHEAAGTLYEAYKAIRQAILMGEHYGLDDEFIEGTLETWLNSTLARNAEQIAAWEWNYAGYFPPFRHRLAVLMSEMIRQGKAGNKIENAPSRDDTTNAFMGVLDLDLSQYRDRETVRGLQNLKLQTWSDLLQWQLAMAEAGDGDPAELERALGLWNDARERVSELERGNVLASQDRFTNVMTGHLWILASRLHKAQGNNAAGNALLAELVTSRNFFEYNAKQWMSWPRATQGGGDWYRSPAATAPGTAIAAARAFLSQAATADDKERKNLYLSAASTLRGALLAFDDETSEDFISTAPELYQLYANVLFKLEWRYRAAAVAMEGLSRFQPDLWGEERSRSNPWLDRSGNLSKSGNMVLRLADDAFAYASGLQVRTGSSALLDSAIDMLRAYKPSEVTVKVEFIQVILAGQSGEWAGGRDRAKEIYASAGRQVRNASGEERNSLMETMLRALRYATQFQYKIWKGQVDDGIEGAGLAAAEEELDGLVNALSGVAKRLIDNPPPGFNVNIARDAEQFVYQIAITKLMTREQFNEVVRVLGPEFWERMPGDEELAGSLLQSLSSAVFRIAMSGASEMQDALKKAKDAPDQSQYLGALYTENLGRLMADWSAYRHARRTFNMVLQAYPGLENTNSGIGTRRRLASIYNVAQQTLRQISRNGRALGDNFAGIDGWADNAFAALAERYPAEGGGIDLTALPFTSDALRGAAGGDVLASADSDEARLALVGLAEPELPGELASVLRGGNLLGSTASSMLLERMLGDGKRYFADLYEPLITDGEKPRTILAVAQTLWELGEFDRAAPLYERYKASLQEDPQVLALLDVEQRMAWIERLGALVSSRPAFAPTWQRRDNRGIVRGNLVDYLVDEPGFNEEWYTATGVGREYDKWPEEKYSWGSGLAKMDEFLAEYDAQRQYLRDYDEVRPQLTEFREAIYSLAVLVGINTNLVEIYRQTGAWDRAKELAFELYGYDQLNPGYKREVVDAVLQAARRGDATVEEIGEARGIAIGLRNIMRDKSDPATRHLYWIAYAQVLELSKAMGDVDSIRDVLADNVRRKIYPWEDLKTGPVPDSYDPGRLGRGEGVVVNDEGAVTGLLKRDAVIACQRFVGLFDLEGVDGIDLPFTVDEVYVTDPENPTLDRVILVVHPKGSPMPGTVVEQAPEPMTDEQPAEVEEAE